MGLPQTKSMRIRDLGYSPGDLPTGPKNSILDVPGVQIGQETMVDGDNVRSGCTVLLPRPPHLMNTPCYAGMHTLNGNGEMTGSYQIKDWGYTNTPIALTNSCSIGIVMHELWAHKLALSQKSGESLVTLSRNYGTPVVAETADWWLNDVHKSVLTSDIVRTAIERAYEGKGQAEVLEGQQGGGAGMTGHEFPAGTGTASRLIEKAGGGAYTVGVLVQCNYGRKPFMSIGGVPVGKILMKEKADAAADAAAATTTTSPEERGGRAGEGSIVIIIFTDAPMAPHQLQRLARHATIGLSLVGGHGVGRNSSGDIFLALSTANSHITEQMTTESPRFLLPVVETHEVQAILNECVDSLFRGATEAVEEAVLNSIVAGREGRRTFDGDFVEGLPVERVRELLELHLVRDAQGYFP